MAKKPQKALDKSITAALSGNYKAPIELPPGRQVIHQHVRHTRLPDVREQIVRIYNEGDPVGFLLDIVNGKMIEVHEVRYDEEGFPLNIVTSYAQATIKQRIDVAKYLAEKYMPRLAVVNHRHQHSLNPEDKGTGQRNFAQIINEAARVTDEDDT